MRTSLLRLVKRKREVAPALNHDFTTGTLPAGAVFTRADAGWHFNASGVLVQASANAPRYQHDHVTLAKLGLLIETGRTNLALHSRDLTNAAWTKTNGTAAKDQVGLDGASNSASSFTATSANATVLQAVTIAGGNKTGSFWVKQLIGTGAIEITVDNGTTWTPVTVNSSSYSQVWRTQSLTNPTFGLRVVTSGDKIAVDCGQMENTAIYPTSPIITTTASVTRGDELCTLALNADIYRQDEFTLFAEFMQPNLLGNAAGVVVLIDDGTTGNFVRISSSTAGLREVQSQAATVTQVNLAGPAITVGSLHRTAVRARANDFMAVFDGGTLLTDNVSTMPTFTSMSFGSRFDSSQYFTGCIRSVKTYKKGLAEAALRKLAS